MSREVLIPGPTHPITIEPTRTRVTVRAGDTVIAESTTALTLRESSYPGVQYVPLTDVNADVLKPSGATTYCPYKGEAAYYSIATPAGEIADAIWYYPQPYDAVEQIAGHVAFYANKVDIAVG